MADREDDEVPNWYWAMAWFCFGVLLLCTAGMLEAAWEWSGVSIDVMVHVGASLLLAPLLPFVEKSLTRRVARENKRMVQQETAGLRERVGSLSTRIDELQSLIDEREADAVQDQDQIIEAMRTEASFASVASGLAVANSVDALAEGEVTLRASIEPLVELTFSWQTHMGDGRFSTPSGTFLGIQAAVAEEPGGIGTPVIETRWDSTEDVQAVTLRINKMLQERGRRKESKAINWTQVFGDLHRAIALAVASARYDAAAPWQLNGSLYEVHGKDWAITEAGIEYRPLNQVVVAEDSFPESTGRFGTTPPSDFEGWPPAPPEGADPAEWEHVLWRGRFHLPVYRGPMRGQPTRRACKLTPHQLKEKSSTP